MSRVARRMAPKDIAAPAVDSLLVLVVALLFGGGLVMMTSASISLAERNIGDPFFYFERQLVAAIIGMAGAYAMLRIPTRVWEQLGPLTCCWPSCCWSWCWYRAWVTRSMARRAGCAWVA